MAKSSFSTELKDLDVLISRVQDYLLSSRQEKYKMVDSLAKMACCFHRESIFEGSIPFWLYMSPQV